jgi:serine/threonine protein kinase
MKRMLQSFKSILDSVKSGISLSRYRTIQHEMVDPSSGNSAEGLPKFEDLATHACVPASNSPIGSQWGALNILEEIGRGAFGVVYRANDPQLRRDEALKLFQTDQGQIEEARKLAQVNSPNVVKVFRFETHDGRPGFAMELVNGVTLAGQIEERGSFSCAEAANIGIDLCKAVSAVHSAGLLHRDIKAQNVMREDEGRVVLMDFGLGENISNQPAMRSLAGTLPYIAPELFTGGKASIQSDVYSLGVLLYYLVSEEYPVVSSGVAGFREAHSAGSRTALRKSCPSVKSGFARIVERAIDPNPAFRYSSADELASALSKWRARRPAQKILLWTATLTIFGLVAIYVTRQPGMREFQLRRITTEDGVSMEPSLSADGRTVAYTSDASGRGDFDIWVGPVDGSRAHRVTDDPAHEFQPTLSPDGKQVVYRSDRSGGGIYIRSVDGGPERLLTQFGLNPRFSPDGREIIFWTGYDAQFDIQPGKIYVVSVAGGTPRQLVSEFKDARLPVWSSNGDEVLFQGCGPGCKDPERETDWWTVHRDGSRAMATGALRDVLNQGLTLYLTPVIWHENDIVFSARMEHGTNLWQISLLRPFGVLRRRAVPLMTSTEEGVEPSMSNNGVISFTGLNVRVDLWKAAIQQHDSVPERLNRNVEVDSMPSISADGNHILYFRRIGNSRKMILKDSEGREVLASDVPTGTRGIIAASGNLVAYSVPEESGQKIYVRRTPMWAPVKISADGNAVLDVFDDDRRLLITTPVGIASVDIASGQGLYLLINDNSINDQATVSPDGKWITFLHIEDANHSQIYVAPMSSSRIGAKDWIPVTSADSWHDNPRWTRDGRSIVFLSNRDDFVCIWKQNLGPSMQVQGVPQAVVHMHKARTSPMHLSRIAFNLSVAQNDIIFNAAELSSNIWIAR